MSLKKSKEANIERSRLAIFLFSLTISSILILIGLEWAKYDVQYTLPVMEVGELIESDIVVQDIVIKRPQPQQQSRSQRQIIDRYEVKPIIEDTTIQVAVDTGGINNITDSIVSDWRGEDTAKPTIEPIIDFVENMPTYIGGLEAMYRELGSYLKPNKTRQSGIVYIEFVVETDGSMSNINIKGGVNRYLNMNAFEAVKQLGRWNPGIQNHHPVRVRMILPIKFTIR